MSSASPRRSTTPAALAAALLLAGALGACGGDRQGPASATTSQTPSASSSSAPASGGPSASSGPTSAPAPPDESGDSAAAPPFPAEPGEDAAEASGGPLSVVAVRVGAHDGFDRVVLELGGEQPGEPGWLVRYVDAPAQDGSGDPVDLAGEAFLQVIATGTGYPQDTGAQEFTGRTSAEGTATVREVVTGAVFEGQTLAHVGLAAATPFRVFRLSDPPRLVVDVQAP